MSGIVTFTNLFPNARFPTHGLFVRERMARVAAAGGFDWRVVAPVPRVPALLRRGDYRRWARVPERETDGGTEVLHPAYPHWPGLSLHRQPGRMAAAALPALRAATGADPAVLDAHYLYPDGVAAAELARVLGLPYVLTARGSDVQVLGQHPRVRARIAEAAMGAAACLAVSRPLAGRFAEIAGLPAGQVVVARNGVDLQRFCPGEPDEARRALGLPQGVPLVLGVGRLVAAKGFHHAAAALPPEAELVLVGDGPDRERIARAAPDRCRFLGARSPDEVAAAYRACDVLVLPSEREGWPNVVTEALASGLRVVATPVGGIPDMLGQPPPPHLGRLVPPGDVAALAGALAEVLAEPGDRQRVRAHAERFSWDATVEQLVALFGGLLGGRR